ncbi:MAG: type II toxin-antitoxin system VapC family toxin [Anaerolineae bacterium]|nr:type II toxin-antitoxin system VapC family toxin [Anaerolineae bacterium]
MKYLLDTNICIALIRHKPASLLEKIAQHTVADIGISSITVAELQYGVYRSQSPVQNEQALALFLLPLTILDFDHLAAVAYGRLRAALEAQGVPVGSLDMLIAAQAVSRGLTVVTNNVREFARVPGLSVEDWSQGQNQSDAGAQHAD